jgi:hypothetical protein
MKTSEMTVALVARASRILYRRELLPARARWWLAAAGMRDWFRVLGRDLRPHLGEETRPVLASAARRLFDRRHDALRAAYPMLPDRHADPRAQALIMAGLYRLGAQPGLGWILSGCGGPPADGMERVRAWRLLRPLSAQARWEEMATQLGELLIVLTEDLPARLPHARRILGEICFTAGARYAERVRRLLRLPGPGAEDAPALAIEVLRMSEYIFHVNPEHWGATDGAAQTGWLEGTACPWYTRPGWNGAHCGIFGQFQSGISSVFGLRYHLSRTIPKHGGSTCRIDLKPIPLRRRDPG